MHTTTTEPIAPSVLTIFGSTGDLSMRYLLPALLHMVEEGIFPEHFKVICVGRRPLNTTSFFQLFLDSRKETLNISSASKQKFLKHIEYFQGDFTEPESFRRLADRLSFVDTARSHNCFNRLYYFATPPEHFEPIAKLLKQQGLLIGCATHERTIRVLFEKPFGQDLSSAKKLNALLRGFFKETQIYRIDHYLGKETVQNLFTLRFANSFLEPIWNKDHIDHIEISGLETLGVGHRAKFYDNVGALRDLVQNHLLQILALMTMDKPKQLSSTAIQKQKVAILKNLKPFTKTTLKTDLVRAQYRAFENETGYIQEIGHTSNTETFVALKIAIKSKRWVGVPMFIRTGKKLSRKITQITVHFKPEKNSLFSDNKSNVLSITIQPDESISMRVNTKEPGFGIDLRQQFLLFDFKENVKGVIPPAYERLLLDFIQGDQRLFIGNQEIEAAWKFIDSITKNWDKTPVESYPASSEGPKGAEDLAKRNGIEWWTK